MCLRVDAKAPEKTPKGLLIWPTPTLSSHRTSLPSKYASNPRPVYLLLLQHGMFFSQIHDPLPHLVQVSLVRPSASNSHATAVVPYLIPDSVSTFPRFFLHSLVTTSHDYMLFIDYILQLERHSQESRATLLL